MSAKRQLCTLLPRARMSSSSEGCGTSASTQRVSQREYARL
jgi:hypothetical protein